MRYLTLAAAGLLAALFVTACDDVDDDAMVPAEPQQMPDQQMPDQQMPDQETPPPTD